MRWFPSLSFSTSASLKSSSSSSSFPASDVDHSKKNASRTLGGVWPFGGGAKKSSSTRPARLRPTLTDHDGRWHDSDNEDNVFVPFTHHVPNSFDRLLNRSTSASSSCVVVPQPLPLPDSAINRQKDADCPLPSPKDVPRPTTSGRGLDDRDKPDAVTVTDGAPSVFRIRR